MLRRSRYVSALAVAACGLLAAGCSAPAGAGSATTPTKAPGQARHASHGWLVFGGVTWRTSDGGINWT